MRLPLAWLHAHCAPDLDASRLASRLAMTGTEVDRIHHHGVSALDAFVVGRVLTCEPHPDADRLRVCTVAVGEGDVSTIVCGAPNVAQGQTVAVARPGAVMPDGTKLKQAKLRGVPSEGMILAEDELALGADHAGIMVLDDALVPGTPLEDVLPLATEVLELEITPNRPDCLSVYGVAREVHAATGAPLGAPPWAEDPGTSGPIAGVEVDVEAPELCPRFTARVFEDVAVGPSPVWLKARLMAAGQRPISNVVDITNYVMLETGQPLHAFDLDRVAGARLTVRRAQAGETLTTLDDVERTLTSEDCLIADADGPTSIAGLMGGERSEVSPATTRVLMEAATWDGPALQRTSARLGLRTEASGRFEKQLAPEQALEGQALAAKLMVELCGARLVEGTIDRRAASSAEGAGPIFLRLDRCAALLGAPVARAEAERVLRALGFGVADGDGDQALAVTVPAHRRLDVTREVDLIEELARLVALDDLPATLPPRRGASGRLSGAQRARRRAEDALVGAGLSEAVGWSFEAPGALARLGLPEVARVRLENPMSEEQSVMRTTLLGSLLDSVRRNRSRGAGDVGLFEVGAVYAPATGQTRPRIRLGAGADDGSATGRLDATIGGSAVADETLHLAALLTGASRRASWRDGAPPPADVFTAKGVLGATLDALGVDWDVVAGQHPSLHPGRAAAVRVAGEPVGWLGELHPSVAARWDLARVAGFEVDLDAVCSAATAVATYRDLTSFPSVRQDLAVVVADDVPAARVLEVVRKAGGALLAHAAIFDVYRGAQVGEGRASLALALEYRAADRTLTDEDVAQRRAKVVTALERELGGELRG